MTLVFSDDDLEAVVRKMREAEELLGRMIRDKRVEAMKVNSNE